MGPRCRRAWDARRGLSVGGGMHVTCRHGRVPVWRTIDPSRGRLRPGMTVVGGSDPNRRVSKRGRRKSCGDDEEPRSRCRGSSLFQAFVPILSEQLARVGRALAPVGAGEVAGGAEFVATPADAL